MSSGNAFVCTTCGQSHPVDTRDWLCACGGLFDFREQPALDWNRVGQRQAGLWRYRSLLPLEPAWEEVSLGEGGTPLLPVEWEGLRLHLKLESLSPTGSFKDRGSSVMLSALRGLGIDRVVEDSSGNAGASISAYAARAGIRCEVCVPDTAAGPKLGQMTAYGAEVIEIRGRREYAALAAWAAAAHGAYYASHIYNPFFLAGMQTLAFELWEQLDQQAPGAVLMPVGNGTLLLGVYRGFQRLYQAGLIGRLPRLLGVQAEACAPLAKAFGEDSTTPKRVTPSFTSATGIAISKPARGKEILAAVRDTDGCLVLVTEEEIARSQQELGSRGFHVEPTSAAAMAAIRHLPDITIQVEPLVVILTGHGLKTHVPRER